MNTSKTLILGAVTIATLGAAGMAGALGATVLAANISNGNRPSIITNLAKTFNLDESKVAQVFTDTKVQAETARLDAAVAANEITSGQKDLIIQKQTEVASKIKEINGKKLTADERQAEMQSLRSDLQAWVTTNKIPQRFAMFLGHGPGMGKGMREGIRFQKQT